MTDLNKTTHDAMSEAERWLARLMAPNCSQQDRADFERWHDADRAHAASFQAIQALWNEAGSIADDPAIQQARDAALRREPAVTRPALLKPGRVVATTRAFLGRHSAAASAAAATGLVLLFFGVIVDRPAEAPITFQTALGEQRLVELPDGSAVNLNTSTVIKVEFSNDLRLVFLEDGQAHFDVSLDVNRPFLVEAGDTTVKALGTAFDVRIDPDIVTVTLIEGSVEVKHARDREHEADFADAAASAEIFETLAPGEQASVRQGVPAVEKRSADLEIATGWIEGNLIFKATRLADAVSEVNRYTTSRIRIGDPKLADLAVSGVFHIGDSRGFVAALEKTFGVKATPGPDAQTVLTRS